MNETKKIVIEDEEIFMKKGFDGWRIIHPIRNENGSINWKNLILGGNIWSFIKILLIFVLLIMAIVIYHYDTKTCSETLRNIDKVCSNFYMNLTNKVAKMDDISKINISNLNLPNE